MSVKIGINGFGRMGRLALRAAYGRPEIEIVHINELKGGSATAAHLLKFDSVHGQWPHQVRGNDGEFRINDDAILLQSR
jgi:glyceraldehyde 3-phosphate dehydrogenase